MRQPKKPRFKHLVMAFTTAAALTSGGHGYFNTPQGLNFMGDNSSAMASEYQTPGLSRAVVPEVVRHEGPYSIIMGKNPEALQWFVNQNAGLPTSISEEFLRQAASIGAPDMVKVLLEARKDGKIAPFNLNASESHSNSALVLAARGNHKDIVQILLENGADINARDVHGSTAISVAGHNRNYDMVKMLIDTGAVVNSPLYTPAADATGQLLRAHILDQIPGDVFQNDRVDVFKHMAKEQKLSPADYADTLLQKAVEANAPKLAQLALDIGATPDHDVIMKAMANKREGIASAIWDAREKAPGQQGPSDGSSRFKLR